MTLLHRLHGWLAVGLWLLTAVLALAGGLLVAWLPEARGHDLLGVPDLVLSLPFLLASATVGALVAARRPANPVGWLLGTCGVLVGLDAFARAYAIQGLFVRPGSLPAAALVAWLNAWTWPLTVGLMLTILPLIFPTGRPPSRTWRPLLWPACGFVVAWTLGGAAFGPGTIHLDWRSGYTLPICGGGQMVADAGLLGGHTATTHQTLSLPPRPQDAPGGHLAERRPLGRRRPPRPRAGPPPGASPRSASTQPVATRTT